MASQHPSTQSKPKTPIGSGIGSMIFYGFMLILFAGLIVEALANVVSSWDRHPTFSNRVSVVLLSALFVAILFAIGWFVFMLGRGAAYRRLRAKGGQSDTEGQETDTDLAPVEDATPRVVPEQPRSPEVEPLVIRPQYVSGEPVSQSGVSTQATPSSSAILGWSVLGLLVSLMLWIGGCSQVTPASVHVSGYQRSDGTNVSSYSRRPPGSRAKDAPWKAMSFAGFLGTCISGLIAFKSYRSSR